MFVQHLSSLSSHLTDPGNLSVQNFTRKSQDVACWPGVYRLCVSLMESLLKTLRYNFINEALDFVGVHQERILQVNSRFTNTNK